jgi:hypothetical protein
MSDTFLYVLLVTETADLNVVVTTPSHRPRDSIWLDQVDMDSNVLSTVLVVML